MMTKFITLLLVLVVSACEFDTITNEEIIHMAHDSGAPAKLGWQTSGTLQTNNKDQPVTLQANFVDQPGEYTVQFGITNPPLDPATGQPIAFNPIATLLWSVEGQDVSRKVSVGNGVSVSGTAQGVKVIIEDDSVFLDPVSGDPIFVDYIVTAQVAKGGRPAKNQPPTFVVYREAQNVGATLHVPIPPGAISVSVSYFPMTPPDITSIPTNKAVVFIGSPVRLKVYDPYVEGSRFVPLPPDATLIDIINSAPAPIKVQVTFGIDG